MMNDKEKMIIHLDIADRKYGVSINRKDEELYRKAATMINERVNKYRERVPGGMREDYIAMVTFDLAFQLTTMESLNDTEPYRQKLAELKRELEERFREEQTETNAG